ncbi:MAG: glycosyltransferase [Schaalia hyovaginalis]|nr:glycosyltransferase [Schaalia hyovaginalis]MCI7671051.1 glycosyltransferase [Schaalia hyovaginalis]MDY3666016.1 glycosyltransferase [Schaalia hyovaginalis]MDY4262098.1 glycosyltransferase [Schaalia hyovaginalis]MDY5505793.1 glycosyltransferase [Schaalia hyovaginalis]MDY5601602.1 glycosyltransferase [Schaalia hyovaginalis]
MRMRTPRAPGLNLLIYPSPLAGPGRVSKIARSLQSSGRFTGTRIVGVDSTDLPSRQDLGGGVELIRIRGANLKDRLGALRILTLWQARVYRAFRNQKVTAVAAQNLFVLPMAHALARRTGAVFAYNAHELETETIASKGLRRKVQRLIERRYIRKADVVSVVNEPIAQWYRSAYPGVEPVVVTNSPVDSGERVDLRTRLSVPDDALLYIHVGFITTGRSVPLILDVFSRHPKAHVVFLGDGALRPEVERAAEEFPNIHWLPSVAPDEVVAHVRGADVGLCLIEHSCLSMALSTPNKLMEALKAGIPPLCSDLVEARRILGDSARTWVLEDPSSQLESAIARITPADVERFKADPPKIPTWDEQAVSLVASYARALDAPDPR